MYMYINQLVVGAIINYHINYMLHRYYVDQRASPFSASFFLPRVPFPSVSLWFFSSPLSHHTTHPCCTTGRRSARRSRAEKFPPTSGRRPAPLFVPLSFRPPFSPH